MNDRDFETLGHNRVGEDEGPVVDLVRRPREIAEASVIVLPSGRLALSTIGFYTVDLGPDVQRLPCLVTLQGILEKAMREAHKSGVAKERARRTMMEANRLAAIARARENQANAELRAKLPRFPDLNDPGLAHAALSANGSLTGPFTPDPTKMRCGATGPRPLSGVPLCCELDAGHKGAHREAGATWTDGAPPATGAGRSPPWHTLEGLAAKALEIAKETERSDLADLGTALRAIAEESRKVSAEQFERGVSCGTVEERARVERLLQDEVDGAHADVNSAEEMAGQARSRRGALRSVLARVVGVAGPTPVEG